MLFKPLTVAAIAASAATSHAFLLPPELSASDVRIAEDLADPDLAVTLNAAKHQRVYLDCPGCPVPEPNLRSRLELDFTIDHQEDRPSAGDRLLLNGFELYPNSDPFRSVLKASQMVEDVEPLEGQSIRNWMLEPQPLGFGMHTGFVAKDADADGGLELVAVDFQVIEIGNTFVAGVPELQVRLVKTPAGRLMIAKIEGAPKMTDSPVTILPPVVENEGEAVCKTRMCSLFKTIFESMKAPGRRPCHGAAAVVAVGGAGSVSGGRHRGDTPNAQWAGRHGHGRHNGWPKMHRHHEHSWGQLFKNIASHILLPVFIGIVAGVSVSLIGMVVGTVIVSLWRTFARRPSHHHHHRRHHSSGHSRRKSVNKEVAVEDEKSGLMVYQDAPPSYEPEDVKKDTDEAV